jgi:hypothetical protein
VLLVGGHQGAVQADVELAGGGELVGGDGAGADVGGLGDDQPAAAEPAQAPAEGVVFDPAADAVVELVAQGSVAQRRVVEADQDGRVEPEPELVVEL